MLPILGVLVVFASVIVGYLLESGNWRPLIQPAECLIICGAALGTMLVANSPRMLIRTALGLLGVLRRPRFTRDSYLNTLTMLREIFDFARRSGISKLDEELEDPATNAILSKYPWLLRDAETLHFICDTLRTVSFGAVSPIDLDRILEQDIDVREQELFARVKLLETLADSLPGLGIVAAILGVVITMGYLGAPPTIIGQKVAAALVGTFLGILLSYGVVAPAAAHLAKRNEAEIQYYQSIRAGLIGFAKSMPTAISVELARRAVPVEVRPDFETVESMYRARDRTSPGAKAA